MKLWLVVYAAGQLGGSWGPLPYGMEECQARAAELRQMQVDTLERGTSDETGEPLTDEQRASVADMTVDCEWHETRPELGTAQP